MCWFLFLSLVGEYRLGSYGQCCTIRVLASLRFPSNSLVIHQASFCLFPLYKLSLSRNTSIVLRGSSRPRTVSFLFRCFSQSPFIFSDKCNSPSRQMLIIGCFLFASTERRYLIHVITILKDQIYQYSQHIETRYGISFFRMLRVGNDKRGVLFT